MTPIAAVPEEVAVGVFHLHPRTDVPIWGEGAHLSYMASRRDASQTVMTRNLPLMRSVVHTLNAECWPDTEEGRDALLHTWNHLVDNLVAFFDEPEMADYLAHVYVMRWLSSTSGAQWSDFRMEVADPGERAALRRQQCGVAGMVPRHENQWSA